MELVPSEPAHEEVELQEPRQATHFLVDEAARYLRLFNSEEPDIIGWCAYLDMLAAEVELDRDSVREGPDGLQGSFELSGAGFTVDFTINEDGVTLKHLSRGGPGGTDYSASLAFNPQDGVIPEAHGIVQLIPRNGQRFFEEGPVGYVFKTGMENTSFYPMTGEMKRGRYTITIASPDSARELDVGDLAPAYHWWERLREVERLSSSGRDGGSER